MRNDKNLDDGYVYFIQIKENGPIKIGFSKHSSAEERLTVAQVYNPETLILLSVIPGGRRKETELHREFKESNIRGEWFKPSEKLIDLISQQNYIGLTVDDFRRLGPNGITHHFWKNDEAGDSSKRARAIRKFKIPDGEKCNVCNNKDAIERYHKDKDLNNINKENIIFVCRSCCMELDGRMDKFRHLYELNPRPIKPPTNCTICNKLYKPLRKGRCHACNEYYRRTGKERNELLLLS